jgi:hypothetical protein
MMGRTRWVAAVMLLGVVTAACGARLPGDVRQQAANSVLRQGQLSNSGGGPAAAPTTGPGGTTAPAPGGPSPQPGQSSGSPATTGPRGQQTTGSGPPTQPSTVPTNNAGGPTCGTSGSDVGLTPTTMTVGTVASLTGPVAGLFQGAIQGMESYASYVDATQGGICGHQLLVDTADDGTNCTQDQNATQNLIGKTFAMVGTVALYDDCGAAILGQNPTVPDVGLALGAAHQKLASHFDVSSKESGYATGMFHYYAQRYGSRMQHVGTILEDIPSAVAQQANQVYAAESQGWKFTDSIKEQPTNSSFVGDFVKMCTQQHIQMFFTVTEDAQNAATMIQNEKQAGCPSSLINVIPIAYDQQFLSSLGGSKSLANGLQGYSEYALFFNPNEAKQIPELGNLQTWFNRVYPGQPLNLYAMYSWAEGRLFQQAMEHAGKAVTQKTVLAALRKIANYTNGGMVAPATPSSKSTGAHCYILWQLENGTFSRVADPPVTAGNQGGYRCDGSYISK